MAKADYTIAAGVLELPSGKCIQVNSPSWWEWLDSDQAVAFTFDCEHGVKNYRARKEAIKGKSGKFWYAYKRYNGTLRKRYIGKSEELTLERLEGIAYDLLTPTKAREPKPMLPNVVGNDVGEYRELLNQSRRIAAQRESDFDRLIAQKVEVCRENQELKEQLQMLHTQLGNTKTSDETDKLKAELAEANQRIANLEVLAESRAKERDNLANLMAARDARHSEQMQDAFDKIAQLKAGKNDSETTRCYSEDEITLRVLEEIIHEKKWRTSIERHRQDSKTNVRYWALVKVLDELSNR